MRAIILASFFAAAAAAASPVVVLDGEVRGIPDGIYAPVVDVRDDTGLPLTTITLADVAVTDGLFEIDLDLAAVASQLAAGTEVIIDVELEGLTAVAHLGAIFAVGSAAHADAALSAASADSLGSIAPGQLIQRDDAGAVPIAFANVVGVPQGVGDGEDNGDFDSLGAGLAISNGTLRVTAVTTLQLNDGSVATGALLDGSFNGASVAGLAAADLASNAVTGAKLATFAFGEVAGTKPVIYAQDIACSSVEGGITTVSSCGRRTCGSGGRVTCGTVSCQQPSSGSSTCTNVALGRLLFAP
jgi:hypothetical protein